MATATGLPRNAFVPFDTPMTGILNTRKVNGSWPDLQRLGITRPPISIIGGNRTFGDNRKGTVILVDATPPSERDRHLVPQVRRGAVIMDDKIFDKKLEVALSREETKATG